MRPILHITTPAEWQRAQTSGRFVDDSLATDGFIHCSTAAQVLIPANERFASRTDLILLIIDPDRLTERLVFEDCYETGHQFPHIYGPINLSAVIDTVAFPPNPDGTFTLPPTLQPYLD